MPFEIEHPALLDALAARGYAEPTPVQAAVLGEAASGRDLLVSAETGSGKTIAYGLAIADAILDGGPPPGAPLALVIAPTRELAIQVHAELSWLYALAGARAIACVGGMDPRREQRSLAAGCHIVVGTPGRLKDHISRGNLDPSALAAVVLDEADEMLDLGFREELDFILAAAPPERRTLLFSATIAKEIASLARQYQREAVRIDTVARNRPHADIEYRAIRIAPREIEHGLVNLLRYHEPPGCLIFCATREGVRQLYGKLLERGFAVVALSGELTQNERNTALQAVRDGRARICIATDVAARGLDLPTLDLVIHADLPTNKATLLHRSGRTGRAGRKGLCLLMVAHDRRRQAERLLASAHIDAVWDEPPAAEAIRLRDQARLLADPALTEPPLDDELAQARELLAAQAPETVALALLRLHRARLPAPEEISPPQPAAPKRDFDRPTVWFRADIGRRQNADPKWLLPLLCKLGGVTRREIGAIRIFERDTRFEVDAESADAFAASIAASDAEFRIAPAAGAPPQIIMRRGKPVVVKPGGEKPDRVKPRSGAPGNRPRGSAPQSGRNRR